MTATHTHSPPPFKRGQTTRSYKTPESTLKQCKPYIDSYTRKWPEPTCKITIYISPTSAPNNTPKGSTRTLIEHELAHTKCSAGNLNKLYDEVLNKIGPICCTHKCDNLRNKIASAAENMHKAKMVKCNASLELQDSLKTLTPTEIQEQRKTINLAIERENNSQTNVKNQEIRRKKSASQKNKI